MGKKKFKDNMTVSELARLPVEFSPKVRLNEWAEFQRAVVYR
jgi:hypothetical protein